MTFDAQQLASYIGLFFGGIAGGAAAGWAWFRRFASGATDTQAQRELHAFERKSEEFHRQFDERLRALEIETGRQKGALEQIDRRLVEILGILKQRRG